MTLISSDGSMTQTQEGRNTGYYMWDCGRSRNLIYRRIGRVRDMLLISLVLFLRPLFFVDICRDRERRDWSNIHDDRGIESRDH